MPCIRIPSHTLGFVSGIIFALIVFPQVFSTIPNNMLAEDRDPLQQASSC